MIFTKLFNKKIIKVALVGPDGVGKSTLIHNMLNCKKYSYEKIVVRHWRPNLLPNLSIIFSNKSKSLLNVHPNRSKSSWHWFRLIYYTLDFTIGNFINDYLLLPDNTLILYDRCALDMLVDPLRYKLRSTKGLELILKIIPKPSMIILLYESPEIVHKRKNELSLYEIKTQLEMWDKLYELGQVDIKIKVDLEPNKIVEKIFEIIINNPK